MKRLRATGIEKAVIGVSGGLDSTQALIVTAKAMDRLGLPRTNVLGYTLPGFATSEQTHQNALLLMQALGVTSARSRHSSGLPANAPGSRASLRPRGALL